MVPSNRFTQADLESFRSVCDPLADEAVRLIFEHREVSAVNHLLSRLLKNDGVPPQGLPPEVSDYLARSGELPSWADAVKIKRGERVFMQHGLYTLGALLCAALPECYTMKNGVKVLAATQKLSAHTVRRLFETAQMVVDVMAPGGLAAGGRGVRAAQKVRLMHAAVRHLILNEPRAPGGAPSDLGAALTQVRWDDAWGKPGNQEDLAFTLLTFSHVILRSLRLFGVRLSPDEAEAYLHCWNVVGYLMGIQEALLARSVAEAEALFEQIKAHQAGPSPEGKALTAALTTFIASVIPYKALAPHIQHTVIRYLVGGETADMLGVGYAGMLERVGLSMMLRGAGIAQAFIDLEWSRPDGCLTGKCFSVKLIDYLLTVERGGDRGLFYIPEQLVDSWGIAEHTSRSAASSGAAV